MNDDNSKKTDEKIIPIVNNPVDYQHEDQKIHSVFGIDSLIDFQKRNKNLQTLFNGKNEVQVQIKYQDIAIDIPPEVIQFCDSNGIEVNSFVNIAFNLFKDLVIHGRDLTEFKLFHRIRNCPFIKNENKDKVLRWIYMRFKKSNNDLFKIIMKGKTK